ncbi:TIGR01244 family sulfur transferase [Amphritea sp. 1_MG-2023]|uniref:TIGR01244 family sulfur transferase n=1 Tax=Amphritea sp. 1_MG-2023 TaxID=3062670 RepID=UPI0026E201CE|nr:TIGR01244 family sulfur transferase [Amphritea sp. 1_MG-2023]MDO6563202.1 TIGR01244 family sulfur transferase [Amphritea sp. 1_MG-2023]
MDIKVLEPGFSICHAIYPSDITELKAQGFRSLICHRQPGEAEDHIDTNELRQAAEAAGIELVEIPVTTGEYTAEAIEAFGVAIETLPTPILGFCRSGRRAVSLWIHNQLQQESCDIGLLLQAAHAAGHDLHAEKDRFTKR